MIYIDNETSYSQRIFIPRDEAPTASTTGHTFSLQEKDYEITENGLTKIHPDAGYDGISGGSIGVYVTAATGVTPTHLNVSEDGIYVPTGDAVYTGVTVEVYDAAYQEGFEDGYNSGYTVGYNEGYSSGVTDGYASGHTDGYQEGYTSGSTDGYSAGYASGMTDGYTSGYTDGHNAGYTSGITYQKSLLSDLTITQNGKYERENGYSAVTVNIATGSTINNQSKSVVLSTADTSVTVTYDSGYTGLESVEITKDYTLQQRTNLGTFTENGDNGLVLDNWTKEVSFKVEVDTASTFNSGYTSGYTDGYATGYTSGSTDGFSSGYTSGSTDGFASGYTSGVTDGYAAGETHQRSLLSDITVTANSQTITSETGYSGITVNIGLSSLSAGTITGNGQYNYSIYDIPEPERPNGWSQINFSVNVGNEYLALVATAVTTTANQSVGLYNPYAIYGKDPNVKRVRIEELNVDVTASTYVFATPGVYTLSYYTSTIAPVLLMQDIALTGVEIMVDSIDYLSFNSTDNKSLSSITFNSGTSVIYIPIAFCDFQRPNASLHNIVIPNSVRNIGDRAFTGGDLRSVVIGNNVRSICYKAFSSNGNLSSITSYRTTAPDLGSLVFDSISSSGTLYVPSSSISSYTNNWLPALPSGWTISAI